MRVPAEALAYALTTCPQFVTFTGRFAEWTDATTPRTDSPVRFAWHFDAHNGGKVQAWTEPYSWQA